MKLTRPSRIDIVLMSSQLGSPVHDHRGSLIEIRLRTGENYAVKFTLGAKPYYRHVRTTQFEEVHSISLAHLMCITTDTRDAFHTKVEWCQNISAFVITCGQP
jgi:hypothetical protein